MLHKNKKIISELIDYSKKTTDELTKSFVQGRGDAKYILGKNPQNDLSRGVRAVGYTLTKDGMNAVKSGSELRQRFGITNDSKEMKNLIAGQMNRNKKEQDAELARIPSATINDPKLKAKENLVKRIVDNESDMKYTNKYSSETKYSDKSISDYFDKSDEYKKDVIKYGKEYSDLNNKDSLKNDEKKYIEKVKREQDAELAKIPSATTRKPIPKPESVNVPKEPLQKPTPLPPKDNSYKINPMSTGSKVLGGAAVAAGLGAATYAAYKMAKKKKWRDKGCSTLSGFEKVKCQEYLKNKKG